MGDKKSHESGIRAQPQGRETEGRITCSVHAEMLRRTGKKRFKSFAGVGIGSVFVWVKSSIGGAGEVRLTRWGRGAWADEKATERDARTGGLVAVGNFL